MWEKSEFKFVRPIDISPPAIAIALIDTRLLKVVITSAIKYVERNRLTKMLKSQIEGTSDLCIDHWLFVLIISVSASYQQRDGVQQCTRTLVACAVALKSNGALGLSLRVS